MTTVNQLLDITNSWIDEYKPSNSSWTHRYIPKNERIDFKDLVVQLPKDKRMKLNTKVKNIMVKHNISRNILESLRESIYEFEDDMEEEHIEDDIVCPFSYVWTQTYDNKAYMEDIYYLASECRKLDRNEYHDEPVLYIGILRIKDPLNKNRIIIKIGFSDNIWGRNKSLGRKKSSGRIETLKDEYGCDFELLGLKKIFQKSDEEQFHAELKKKFPHLIVNMKVKGRNKTEVYVFDRDIYQRFLDFVPRSVKTNIDEKTERKVEKYFEDSQERLQNYFQNPVTDEEQPQRKKRKLNTI
jgi:hypothetical protein